MKIVDEFTGRILEGRRWSEGLHQAVEAKERVKIKEENQTLATITLQNYFRMYDKLAGMTGTAVHRGGRVRAHLRARGRVDPHQPADGPRRRARPHLQDRGRRSSRPSPTTSPSATQTGQPVLVGTISVEKSEQLVAPAREARASRTRCSTPSSTSGRRTSSRRPGASARSPSPPTWPAAASTSSSAATPRASPQQELLAERHAPSRSRRRSYAELVEQFTVECAERGRRRSASSAVSTCSAPSATRAGASTTSSVVVPAARAIPGESRFYLSLEDDLMRLFATGAMNWVMGKAFPDDVPLEAKMVTKAIERAQRTVEDRNFEIRKDVLKYDEVMNEQRKVIYRRRQQILDGGDLRDEAFEAIEDGGRARRARQLLPERVPRGLGPRRAPPPDATASTRRASRASSSTTARTATCSSSSSPTTRSSSTRRRKRRSAPRTSARSSAA